MTAEVKPGHGRVRISRRVLAITAETDAATALTVMHRHGVRHLPVLRDRWCVGLVTETDLLRSLAVRGGPATVRAGLLCHSPAPSVPDGTEPAAVAAAILAGGADAVLAVRDGVLVGIVTSADVLALIADQRTGGTE